MKKSILLSALTIAAACGTAAAAESYNGYEVAPEGAWCWFADPRAMHNSDAANGVDASYLGYIDVHGNIKATQYDFKTGTRSETLVRSYFQPDDHNNPTFLVLPDGRVLIIYSRHTDEAAFYYRVSTRPGDITSLGEEKRIATSNNTTYPSPFILSDDPDHFYLCWRGIGWHPTIARFTMPDENDEVKADWGPYRMVKSTGARPYAKYYSNGKDKIYVTYTTGHPDNEQPNWIYFNAININASKENDGSVSCAPALEDINGKVLKKIADGPFDVNKTNDYRTKYPATVVDSPADVRDWVWQIATDKEGKPVIAMVRINGGKTSHDYYYARWTGSDWKLTLLTNGGGKFHSSNTEKCYSGGMTLDPDNANVVYLSKPTEGTHGSVFEIWKYTVSDDGKVESFEQITKNSAKNNVRPYILPGSSDSPLRLGWMTGDYYYWMVNKSYPAGFPTSLRCDYDFDVTVPALPATAASIAPGAVTADATFDVTAPAGEKFTVSVDAALDAESYSGTLLKADGFELSIDADRTIPVITINGKQISSTNPFYTSDNWKFNSNGTNSDNWPTKLGSFNLTVTYDGKYITLYRDGMIDIKAEAAAPDMKGLKAGGFKGSLNGVRVYNEAIDQNQVKMMISDVALEGLAIPGEFVTDFVFPAKASGLDVTWTSSEPAIISESGIFTAPKAETDVTLTATVAGRTKDFAVKALPRDIARNLIASYDFEKDNVTEKDGDKTVRDLSGNGRDLLVKGNAKVEGTLDLSANTAAGFEKNGYAIVPAGLLAGLRSYTVSFDAVINSTSGAPRIYDFGCNNGNSLFFRAAKVAAGLKLGGGTTNMVQSDKALPTKTTVQIAVTFSAGTGATTIYVDGEELASGKNVTGEPYMLAQSLTDGRNYIGRTQWWDTSYAKDNVDFVGTIDNFRVYNTALTPEEIKFVQKGVSSVVAPVITDGAEEQLYDINGRRVSGTPAPGIYIRGNEKILIR